MFLPALEYTASQGGTVGFTLQFRLGSVAPAVEDVEAALVWIRRQPLRRPQSLPDLTGKWASRTNSLGTNPPPLAPLPLRRPNPARPYPPRPERYGGGSPEGRTIPRRPPKTKLGFCPHFSACLRRVRLHRGITRRRPHLHRRLPLAPPIWPATTPALC